MREKISLNSSWMFHKGDIIKDFPRRKLAAYDSAKTERAIFGPASQNYNTGAYSDEIWTDVDLPHDFVIDQIFNISKTPKFRQIKDGVVVTEQHKV